MMKRLLVLAAALLTLGLASAKPVSADRLFRVAEWFFPGQQLSSAVYLDGLYLIRPDSGRGFVLLSADDCLRPVLAYSLTSTFDPQAIPDHVRAWIDGYAREAEAMLQAGAVPSAEVSTLWEFYLNGSAPKTVADTVAPLLTTTWNQSPRYNSLCPYDTVDSAFCVSGCVATATTQIMKYWNHPAVGWGSHSYVHSVYGTQSAVFDTTHYRWHLMPDALTSLSSDSEIYAVAELTYHVGVAVEMRYSPHGSGAYTTSYGYGWLPSSENALKSYFRYSPMLRSIYKSEYVDSDWDNMLRIEIDAARPVLYSGSDSAGGHAFVLDGYDTLGMFHVNWGWGGAYDGYYTTDSLSPGAGGIGGNATYTFNMNNAAVIGICPATAAADSVAVISVVPDNIQHGTVSGSGTYRVYEDTVLIVARAAEGYRFTGWKSGSTQNPMTFLVNGDIVDTACFERISGDTLGYCTDGLRTSWQDDYGSVTEWGIRIPASMRGTGRKLTAVQMFVYAAGVYTFNIYYGNSIEPSTLVRTQEVDLTGQPRGWVTVALDSALNVDEHTPVFITVRSTDYVYPAAHSSYSGNGDGTWYHLPDPDGWVRYDEHGVYCSWMLRGIFEPRRFTITVMPNDQNACTTYGGGEYWGGDSVTIGAVLFSQSCQFLRWTDGSPYNPYTFVVSADTLMIAYCSCDGLGIDDVEPDALEVSVEGRRVSVSAEACFFDIQGRLLATGRRFTAPAPGVYILRTETATKKVVVI